MPCTRTIVLNDIHGPFNDDRLIGNEMQGIVPSIIKDLGIDRIFLNGDIVDFLNLSSHNQNVHPKVEYNLDMEVEWLKTFLVNMRKKFPNTEIIFQCGNHEHRWDRDIIKKAPYMYNRLLLEHELECERYDIEFYPYNNRYQLEDSKTDIQHSPPSYSSAKAASSRYPDRNSIYGCSHRFDWHCSNGSNEIYKTVFNGWLSNVRANTQNRLAFEYRKNHVFWQNCLSVATVEDRVKSIIEPVLIENYKCIVDGVLYSG